MCNQEKQALSRSSGHVRFCCLSFSGSFYRRAVPTRSQIQLGHIARWVYTIASIAICTLYSVHPVPPQPHSSSLTCHWISFWSTDQIPISSLLSLVKRFWSLWSSSNRADGQVSDGHDRKVSGGAPWNYAYQ